MSWGYGRVWAGAGQREGMGHGLTRIFTDLGVWGCAGLFFQFQNIGEDDMNIPDKYRTQNLFLLIGTNPLPNYVAARLLLADGGNLYLVHSKDTGPVADRICEALDISLFGDRVTKISISDDDLLDGYEIYQKVREHAAELQDIHLNYTGGTKMMVANSYRAIRQANPDASFSYLDKKLKLVIDHPTRPAELYAVGTAVHLTLETLMKMHGVTFDKDKMRCKAVGQEICKALAELYIQDNGPSLWKDWIEKSNHWTTLPSNEPGLKNVERAFRKMCSPDAPTPDLVAQKLGIYDHLRQYGGWFGGKWLEDYVLHTLQSAIQGRDDIKHIGLGLDFKGRGYDFEFDVAAMRGYQLFAISCKTSSKKSKCKLALFEAYVRAQQMGGDEARVALVCTYDRPGALRAEIEAEWDAEGKIRVFGRNQLLDLEAHLQQWFDSQP